jgi:hypothetical protein
MIIPRNNINSLPLIPMIPTSRDISIRNGQHEECPSLEEWHGNYLNLLMKLEEVKINNKYSNYTLGVVLLRGRAPLASFAPSSVQWRVVVAQEASKLSKSMKINKKAHHAVLLRVI